MSGSLYHYKIDMYNEAQLAGVTTKVGDILTLSVPQGDGTFKETNSKVIALETEDAQPHPKTKVKTFRQILTLEDQ